MLTRKKVRDAARACLSHQTKGFNARMVEGLDDYPFGLSAVDFTPGSGSFFQASIDPEQFEISQEDGTNNTVINLYTTAIKNDRQTVGAKFAGTVQFHVDVHIRIRNDPGQDSDIEDAGDSVESAVIDCLYDDTYGLHIFNVSPRSDWECIKDPAKLQGDGWLQRIPIIIPCEVTAL